MNCPSCKTEFDETRDTAYHCKNCGWMQCIDGRWVVLEKEPPKIKEPDIKPEPKPIEPNPITKTNPVRSYLGGLITITEIKDDAENND